ncbi:site-specific DNA-methyltransferase [Brevibacillus humidisoli]|uniref:DNA-methyltransferase n=1 Tax=Brevibacillus humidisoli TaxID=2895522 RepID=UPI001E3AFA6B|nr:site-specific DNA-methyltransferase [Brevibacillus humidisoli]UFJ40371.1 site-specific DNA-methyltransferase [Brevibacillus humidisoli]
MTTDLFQLLEKKMKPKYSTKFGMAFCDDSIEFIKRLPSDSIDLIMTSPPFALTRPKKYGNKDQEQYVNWFVDHFAAELLRILKPTGSLVVDIGGSYKKGVPVRSLYHFELAIELTKKGFHLAQEFYWFNPAKMPAPVQWVNIERVRVRDSVNPVWWFSKTEHPKADNRRVLKPYTKSMKKLLERGYNPGPRDSEHVVGHSWQIDNQGAIPENLLINAWPFTEEVIDGQQVYNLLALSNTSSNDEYSRRCRKYERNKHPARFPIELPSFFINFLTEPGDVVFDPFGGSCSTGKAAEDLARKWITCEIDPYYVETSRLRFFECLGIDEAASTTEQD